MTGNSPLAWRSPSKGMELAIQQIDQGADIIFAAAGRTGLGVYQAAADNKILAIGVDANQNYLHPGHMLSSVLKRVDNVLYQSLKDGYLGHFKAGTFNYGLAEEAVDYSLDKHNKHLITQEVKNKLNNIKKKIINKEITTLN